MVFKKPFEIRMLLMILDQHVESFLSYLQYQKRYSLHTLKAYKEDLKKAENFFENDLQIKSIHDIKSRDVRSWIYHLNDLGLVPRSINRSLSSLKSFFRFLVKKEVLITNQASEVSSLKMAKKLPEYFEADTLRKLLVKNDKTDYSSLRDFLIVSLIYNTGLRCSEVVNLADSQFDYSNQVIKVVGKGNKERVVHYSDIIGKKIEEYLSEREKVIAIDKGSFFITDKGRKLYPKFVYNTCDKVLSYISTKEKRNPHTLRHSFATHLLDEGANINAIKELLGHSSLSATQVYTHNSISKLQKIYENAHPRSKE